MIKKMVLAVLLIVMPVCKLFSYTYLGVGHGDPVISFDARSLGMGNTGIASSYGSGALFTNPANMLKARQGAVTLSAGMYPIKEQVEDSNDDIYYNSQYYYQMSNISIVYPVRSNIRLGFGRAPVYDFNYINERNIYIDGELNEQRSYSGAGSLVSTTLSAGMKVMPNLSIGFNCSLIGGRIEQSSTTVNIKSTKNTVELNKTGAGVGYDIGVNWKPSDVLEIAFNWHPEYEIEFSGNTKSENFSWDAEGEAWTETGTDRVDKKQRCNYPAQIGMGIKYEFWEQQTSVLSIDMVKTNWENFRYKEVKDKNDPDYNKKQDPDYRNTTRISVGVEHYLSSLIILRYGFMYFPCYAGSGYDTTMITGGVGFPISSKINMDIGAGYGRRNYIGAASTFSEPDLEVDERIAKILVSAEFKF